MEAATALACSASVASAASVAREDESSRDDEPERDEPEREADDREDEALSLREAVSLCEAVLVREAAFLRDDAVDFEDKPVRDSESALEDVFLRPAELVLEDVFLCEAEPVLADVFLRGDDLEPESAPAWESDWASLAREAADVDRLFLVTAPAPSARAKTDRQIKERMPTWRNLSNKQTGTMDLQHLPPWGIKSAVKRLKRDVEDK